MFAEGLFSPDCVRFYATTLRMLTSKYKGFIVK